MSIAGRATSCDVGERATVDEIKDERECEEGVISERVMGVPPR
jgi:hypothetical protein